MKDHLKRIAAPKTWRINRKSNTFIKRPLPGMQTLDLTISITTFLTELTKICLNKKEVNHLLTFQDVKVDGVRRKENKFPVAFGCTIAINDGDFYRLSVDLKGKLIAKTITKEEASLKSVTIVNKTPIKKGLQINLSDGRNIIIDKNNKEYAIHNSLLLKLPEQKIEKVLPFKKGATGFVFKGSHKGTIVELMDFKDDIVHIKYEDKIFETKKDYLLIIDNKLTY